MENTSLCIGIGDAIYAFVTEEAAGEDSIYYEDYLWELANSVWMVDDLLEYEFHVNREESIDEPFLDVSMYDFAD